MDLFHAITQSIDNVLTCHWYEEGFKSFKMDKTMDTEPGGESNQFAPLHATKVQFLWLTSCTGTTIRSKLRHCQKLNSQASSEVHIPAESILPCPY